MLFVLYNPLQRVLITLAENFVLKRCKHCICPDRLSPTPYYNKKEQTRKKKTLYVCSFSVSDIFAVAKVMLFAMLIMMLLAKALGGVVLAHCVEGTTLFTQ